MKSKKIKICHKNISLDDKSCEYILIYDISQKTFMDVQPLRFRFDKVYGIIKIYEITRYFELINSWFYRRIYDRIMLKVKKAIMNMVLIITLQKSESIHLIVYVQEKYKLFVML